MYAWYSIKALETKLIIRLVEGTCSFVKQLFSFSWYAIFLRGRQHQIPCFYLPTLVGCISITFSHGVNEVEVLGMGFGVLGVVGCTDTFLVNFLIKS